MTKVLFPKNYHSEIRTINIKLFLLRMAQIGLLVWSAYSLSNAFEQTSKAIDFTIGSPASSEDIERNTLLEVPYAMAFGNPDKVINDALDQKDYGRAKLYVDYFYDGYIPGLGSISARSLGVSQATLKRYEDAINSRDYYWQKGQKCLDGAVLREAQSTEGVICIIASDFFVVGDIADLSKQGLNWATGSEVDEVIVGLSIFGLGASLTSFNPASAGAAAGVGVAKGVLKSTKQSKFFGKPFRRMVKEAVDYPALKKSLSDAAKHYWTFDGWSKTLKRMGSGQKIEDPLTSILSNPAKFLRREPASRVMDVLNDANSIYLGTDATFTMAALKRVDSAQELKTLKRTVATYGKQTKYVSRFVGKNAPKVAKLSRPYVRWAKHTYKASSFGFGIGAIILTILSEVGFRAWAGKEVKRLREWHREELTRQHGSADAWQPKVWYLTVIPIIAIAFTLYYADGISKSWSERVEKAQTLTSETAQHVAINGPDVAAYLDTIPDVEAWFLDMSRYDPIGMPPLILGNFINYKRQVLSTESAFGAYGPYHQRFRRACVEDERMSWMTVEDYRDIVRTCAAIIAYAKFRFGAEAVRAAT